MIIYKSKVKREQSYLRVKWIDMIISKSKVNCEQTWFWGRKIKGRYRRPRCWDRSKWLDCYHLEIFNFKMLPTIAVSL